MKPKLSSSYLISVGGVALFCWVAYTGISNETRKQVAARQLEIERSAVRAIDHVCAPWKEDGAQFSECGDAFRVYEKCELVRLQMLERNGDMSARGVVCEHPVYQFHAREQQEIDDVRRSVLK